MERVVINQIIKCVTSSKLAFVSYTFHLSHTPASSLSLSPNNERKYGLGIVFFIPSRCNEIADRQPISVSLGVNKTSAYFFISYINHISTFSFQRDA